MTSAQTRKLAAQIQKAVAPDAPVPALNKGTVTAWNSTASPPTVTVQLSGASSGNTADYQYLASYLPTVGDVVNIVSRAGKHLVMGTVATSAYPLLLQDWTVPTPFGGGVSSGGGGAGPVKYRVIMQEGQIKTQIKGSVTISGGASTSPFGLFTLNNLAAPDSVNRMISCITTVGLAYIQYDWTDNVANLMGGTGATAVIFDGHEFFPTS